MSPSLSKQNRPFSLEVNGSHDPINHVDGCLNMKNLFPWHFFTHSASVRICLVNHLMKAKKSFPVPVFLLPYLVFFFFFLSNSQGYCQKTSSFILCCFCLVSALLWNVSTDWKYALIWSTWTEKCLIRWMALCREAAQVWGIPMPLSCLLACKGPKTTRTNRHFLVYRFLVCKSANKLADWSLAPTKENTLEMDLDKQMYDGFFFYNGPFEFDKVNHWMSRVISRPHQLPLIAAFLLLSLLSGFMRRYATLGSDQTPCDWTRGIPRVITCSATLQRILQSVLPANLMLVGISGSSFPILQLCG